MSSRLIALGIHKMSNAEREDLIHEILDSIEADIERAAATPEQLAEARRRFAEYGADPSTAVSWQSIYDDSVRRIG